MFKSVSGVALIRVQTFAILAIPRLLVHVCLPTEIRLKSPDFDRMPFAPIEAHRQVFYVNVKSLL